MQWLLNKNKITSTHLLRVITLLLFTSIESNTIIVGLYKIHEMKIMIQ